MPARSQHHSTCLSLSPLIHTPRHSDRTIQSTKHSGVVLRKHVLNLASHEFENFASRDSHKACGLCSSRISLTCEFQRAGARDRS